MRRALLVPVLTLTLVGALAACGGSPAKPAPGTGAPAAATTGPAPAKGGLSTVATLSGTGAEPQDTLPFTLHGGSVQFVYEVQPNDVGPVPLLWKLYRKGEPANPASAVASDSCASCAGKQSNDLGKVPAGDYYLHLITSRPWTLTVQEQG